MSDQRPEWMPEEQVILMIQDGEYIDSEIDAEFHRTGLRAQIAVLEEMMPKVCSDCAAGNKPLEWDNGTRFHYAGPSDSDPCHASAIHQHIAALRKELAP